jgi:hypothetical protein
VTEKVIETLTDAVRQRIRGSLEPGTSGGTAADKRQHPGVDTGKTLPPGSTEQDGDDGAPGPQHPAGDDGGA